MLTIHQLSRPGLAPFDLDLAGGECVSLSGPSGAGKTILLRAIADLDPTEGKVSLDGTDRETFAAPEWRRNVCFLAAEPGWWAETARAHFPVYDGAVSLLPDLGLSPGLLDQPLSQLSTGERQRLALARLLLVTPRVMLLDEPTSALDSEATAQVEKILNTRLAGGASALLVTHAREQARRMARRHLAIDHGRVTEATA